MHRRCRGASSRGHSSAFFSHFQETSYAVHSRRDSSHSSPSRLLSLRRSPCPRKAATPAPSAAQSPILPAPSSPAPPFTSPTRSADSTAPPPPTPLGQFAFSNVPFNTYRINVSADGFAPLSQNVGIQSVVGINLKLVLQIAGASQTVTVESTGDLVETDPTFHTDVDRDLFIKVPMESQSSSLSSLVTETTPGVAADSNGLFHGLGDHASNSFSVDGQSITDQQSKVFSNQIPSNSIQSIQVISGAPPAEYGDKTSLVIVATTRSGQGITKPTGSISTSYGAFGSATGGFDLSYGGKNWGNFIEADGLNTGRFLDPPEFVVFHDKGNEQNIFDRVDYTFTPADSIHLDLNYSRSWFQTPNSYDNLNVQNVVSGGASASPVFANVGNTDQHSKIGTFNISPTYTRIISNDIGLQPGRIRPQRRLQLLPQRQSTRRPRPGQSANLVHRAVPHPHQRRRPL